MEWHAQNALQHHFARLNVRVVFVWIGLLLLSFQLRGWHHLG